MKKLLALLLALTSAVSITACNKDEPDTQIVQKKEDKYKIAIWEDYDKMPFMELLEKGSDAYYSQLFPDLETVNVTYEKGWEKAPYLNEEDASKGHRPVTYIVELKYGGDINGTVYFFMERKSKKLQAVACHSEIGADASDVADKDATENIIEDFTDALDYIERKGNITDDAGEAQFASENMLDAYCEYDYVTAETYMSTALSTSVTTIKDTVESNKTAAMEDVISILDALGLDFETYEPQFDKVYDNVIDKLEDSTSYTISNVSGINGTYTVNAKLKLPNKDSIPDPVADFDVNSFSASMMVKAIKNGYIDYSGNFKDGVTEQDLIDFVAKELVSSLNKKVDDAKIKTTDKLATLTVSWIDGEWLVTSFEIN